MTGSDQAPQKGAPEFSRRVPLEDISDAEVLLDIEADPVERKALSARFDLLAMENFSARVGLRRSAARDGSGKIIRVTLAINATVTQSCVVTLEPVTARIEDSDIVVEFRPAETPDFTPEVDIAPETDDPPEILMGNEIDVGELAAEHLALALDPYPRAEGAEASATAEISDGAGLVDEDRPFAALKDWPNRANRDKE